MRRLFHSWDTDKISMLSLQNVVSGLVRVTGTRDIMSSISYFFELYDDDGNGKVDREGILGISEALLFLSRRGLGQSPKRTSSATDVNDSPNGDSMHSKRDNGDEQFLSSVSAFIRRCFEYADPDHPVNRASQPEASQPETSPESASAFTIGEDDEDEGAEHDRDSKLASNPPQSQEGPATPTTSSQDPNRQSTGSIRPDSQSANIALDPANPLHITLPTFRMVILADETLEHFFDSAFSNSFRLSDSPLHPSSTLSSSNLTTFSSLTSRSSTTSSGGSLTTLAGHGKPVSAVAPPPGKGLRGMLDNIVSDGMRVAAEVRRRMDEAQREMDRVAAQQVGDEEDEDGEEGERGAGHGVRGGSAETRSVREGDRELLEGAEAEVEVEGGDLGAGAGAGADDGVKERLVGGPIERGGSGDSGGLEPRKVLEFEW